MRALPLLALLATGCYDFTIFHKSDDAGGTPDLATADQAMPDQAMPDLARSDVAMSDQAMRDLAMPDIAMADQSMPDLQMPDLQMPDLQMPDQSMPDLQMPDQRMPDLRMPDQQMPDLQLPDLQMPDLQTPDLQMPDLQRPDLTPPADLAVPARIWKVLPNIPNKNLRAVWAFDAKSVWVVGDGGTMLRTTDGGQTWVAPKTMPVTAQHLFAVWGTGTGQVYAAGDGGTFWRSPDGDNFTADPQFTIADLRGIWSRTKTDVYVCGSLGVIAHYDGIGWGVLNVTAETWLSIAGGPNDIYVVGTSGKAEYNGGNGWVNQPTGTAQNLYEVAFIDPKDPWVAGFSSTVRENWQGRAGPGVNELLNTIWVEPNEVFTGGFGGAIYRSTDGAQTWSSTPINGTPPLNGMFGAAGIVWVVGATGTIVRSQ